MPCSYWQINLVEHRKIDDLLARRFVWMTLRVDLAVMATVFASPSCFATQAAEVSSRKPALLL